MLYDLFFAFLQTGRYREARKIIEVKTQTGAVLFPFHMNAMFLFSFTSFFLTLSVLVSLLLQVMFRVNNSLLFHHHPRLYIILSLLFSTSFKMEICFSLLVFIKASIVKDADFIKTHKQEWMVMFHFPA